MRIIRPTPEQIAARKWEIARRYKQKAKVGKRSRGMAAIRLSELTKWLHDWNGEGAELEPSQSSVEIVRLFCHHFGSLPDTPRRITAWLGDYAPWIKGADREILISEAVSCPLKWSADKLAWKLRLTDANRTRLKITTIGAIDCSKADRIARRKAKRKERDKWRYQARRLAKLSARLAACSPTI
jgi:hypothetical protein